MTMNSRSTVPLLVQDLRCEYQDNSLGIDVVQPRLSWKLASEQRGVAQAAYQIQVTDTSDVLWETGKILSHQSIHVPCSSRKLFPPGSTRSKREPPPSGRYGMG